MNGLIGVIAIGRNEGEHLRRCLASVVREDTAVVYVDSGSDDGSQAMARDLGVHVVELDMSVPFTAARARNAGLDALTRAHPEIEWVQFIDGDCELIDGWLDTARDALAVDPKTGSVFGRRYELNPDASTYNLVCHVEWDTPISEQSKFGGEHLARIAAIREAGNYNPEVIAGEDTELCYRMVRAGWKAVRVDAAMSRHDARITRFSQWWKRAERAGHCFAQLGHLHAGQPGRPFEGAARRVWFWAVVLPVLILALLWPTKGWSLLGLGLYAVTLWRTYRYGLSRGWGRRPSLWYAWYCTLGKFAEWVGWCRFHLRRLSGRQMRLIEYKAAGLAKGG